MTTSQYWQSVNDLGNRQYKTGEKQLPGKFVPDDVYSQALDALVVACGDVLPVVYGRILIGKRSWEPQPDWWCIGGRMRKGETYQEAASRNVRRELGLTIAPDRYQVVGMYNLIWDKRAQAPAENGCHMLSVLMLVQLTDAELAAMHLNEEYEDATWVDPEMIVNKSERFHPCLVQMAKDVQTRLNSIL